MWLVSCRRQGMLTQEPTPDFKCRLTILSFLTLPYLGPFKKYVCSEGGGGGSPKAYESVQGEGGCFFKDVLTLFKKNSALFFHDIFLQKSFNFFGMKLGLSHSVLKSIECCVIFPISMERVLVKKSNKIIRLSY